jgi:two-component system, response regulator PdtaR
LFNADARTLARLAPRLQRVLIVDSNAAAARLLADLMKEMGTREVYQAASQTRALGLVRDGDPQIVFTEFNGPELDGVDFARAVRRSPFSARKNPIIMVTAEATAASIIAARNAGVHEFLRKPYTAGDLFRRVENVVTKPRDWIEAQMYVGPDRRRFNSGEFAGARKRRADQQSAA